MSYNDTFRNIAELTTNRKIKINRKADKIKIAEDVELELMTGTKCEGEKYLQGKYRFVSDPRPDPEILKYAKRIFITLNGLGWGVHCGPNAGFMLKPIPEEGELILVAQYHIDRPLESHRHDITVIKPRTRGEKIAIPSQRFIRHFPPKVH